MSLCDPSQLHPENYYLKHTLDGFYSACEEAINVCNNVNNHKQAQVYQQAWNRIEARFEDEFGVLMKRLDNIDTKLYEFSARITILAEIHASLPPQMRTKYEKEYKRCKEEFLKKKTQEDEKLLANLRNKYESFAEVFKMAVDNYVVRSKAADDEMRNKLIDMMTKQVNEKQKLIAKQLAAGVKSDNTLIKSLGEVNEANEYVKKNLYQNRVKTKMKGFIDSIRRLIAQNVETSVDTVIGYLVSGMCFHYCLLGGLFYRF